MDAYERVKQEELAKQKAKAEKVKKLEKELKVLDNRKKDLLKIGSTALDPVFWQKEYDKCCAEINRISQVLARI